MINDLRLGGCRPTPLASYLKALGILRLVAEQKDSDAKGWWRAERFWLRTKLSREELTAFFLNDYAPSPIIAPWNGGSGFYFQEGKSKEKDPATGKKIKTGKRDQPTEATRALDAIAKSTSPRLNTYRQIIAEARQLIQIAGLQKAPSEAGKAQLVLDMRRSISEEALFWLDASLALTTDALRFPPLLGTGGNDGNLDFTSNYMQRLSELFSSSLQISQQLIKAAIFGTAAEGLTSSAVGQFAPAEAGGPNSTSGFEGGATVNPWNFIFILEGALVISGGVVRRFALEDRSAASFPFTVRATGAGFGTASQPEEPDSRGEFWAPIWTSQSGFGEAQSLFREGRIAQTKNALRDGMDAALAIASVGADRRISGYQRYGFQKRQGLAFLATPLGYHAVRPNPATELSTDLARRRWLERVRKVGRGERTPARLALAVRALEDSLFALAGGKTADTAASGVIISIGRIARIIACSKALREALPPPPLLRHEWIEACGDDVEVRLASALAGLWLRRAQHEAEVDQPAANAEKDELPFRAHIAPINASSRRARSEWTVDGSSGEMVWTEGNLVDSLVAVALRRSVEATRTLAGGGAFSGSWRRLARLDDVTAFLAGDVDDERINDLALGFAWVAPSNDKNVKHARATRSPAASPHPLPLAYAAIKPIFSPTPKKVDTARASLKFAPTIAPLLASGRSDEAVKAAMRRAQADGLPTPFMGSNAVGVDPRRLLASLLFPVSESDLQFCQNRAYPAEDKERANENAA